MGRSILLLLLAFSAAASAQTYRWVDEKGVTVYGDRVPPQYKDSAQVELSGGGMPLKKIAPALTPQQRAEMEAKKASDAEAAAKKEAVDRIDRALVSKYANAGELAAAHGRDIDRIDDELVSFTARAMGMSERAKVLYSSKRINRDQRFELEGLSNDLSQVAEIIERKLAERLDALKRHKQERARFEELMGRKASLVK
jgi:hypothetical protein